MELKKDRFEIASDVNSRDGIGVEIYRDNKLKVEIFRDDTKRNRIISIFDDGKFIDIPLDLMEEAINNSPLNFMRPKCHI